MNSLELINKLYKPYKITKQNKCIIFESTEGKYVVKPKENKDIKSLYNYLKSRNFTYFPELVDESRSDVNIFEYVDDLKYPKEQKALDLTNLISLLHSKTVYSREVTEDKFKEIYDNISSNLDYFKHKYEEYVTNCENEIFMSPSHYLFIRNSSKLLNQVEFCHNKLNEWYETVKNKRSIRVSVIHNNLSLDHYIKNRDEYLISWEQSGIDSPVLDIYKWYKKECLNLEFGTILKNYLKNFPLEEDEKNLLLIMFCMPEDFEIDPSEYKSCSNIRKTLDYIYKTEELVRPYYSVDNKE